jgi:hypothetical protein
MRERKMRDEAASRASTEADPNRGDWINMALSIASTIGKVAGALAGASEDAVVDFGPTGTLPNIGSLLFWNKNGQIEALNTDGENPVTLDFPSDTAGPPHGESVTVKKGAALVITPAFKRFAEVDSFAVTPWRGPKAGRPLEAEAAATVRTSTTQPVQSGVEVELGSFFKLRLNASERTLTIMTVGAYTLAALILVNVKGARPGLVQIINAIRRQPGSDGEPEPTSADVSIPLGIDLSSGLHFVELVAEINGIQAALERQEQEGIYVWRALTEEDYARLERINAKR